LHASYQTIGGHPFEIGRHQVEWTVWIATGLTAFQPDSHLYHHLDPPLARHLDPPLNRYPDHPPDIHADRSPVIADRACPKLTFSSGYHPPDEFLSEDLKYLHNRNTYYQVCV